MHPEIFHITLNNSLREIHATVRETFLTVSVLRRSVSSLGQDFQLGSQGVYAPSGWVSFYTVGTRTHTHIHSTPVMLGRFQPAASERSALEFLRPKEISNWVMDMVTWTMRRQREAERAGGEEGERENEGMKHNMSSLSVSPPHDWPWLQCPKTNLSGN